MKQSTKKLKVFFALTLVCFVLNAISYTFMSISIFNTSTDLQNGLRIYFWVTLLGAYLFLIILIYLYKKRKVKSELKMIGLFHFCTNRYGKCASVLALLSGIISIICLVINYDHYITYICISIFAATVPVHAMFDGKIYSYISNN